MRGPPSDPPQATASSSPLWLGKSAVKTVDVQQPMRESEGHVGSGSGRQGRQAYNAICKEMKGGKAGMDEVRPVINQSFGKGPRALHLMCKCSVWARGEVRRMRETGTRPRLMRGAQGASQCQGVRSLLSCGELRCLRCCGPRWRCGSSRGPPASACGATPAAQFDQESRGRQRHAQKGGAAHQPSVPRRGAAQRSLAPRACISVSNVRQALPPR